MCRDIKILRAPYAATVGDQDVQAAAIQYVQTVTGFRRPLPADAEAFDRAVSMIASVTRDLLGRLEAPTADHTGSLPAATVPPWWGRA